MYSIFNRQNNQLVRNCATDVDLISALSGEMERIVFGTDEVTSTAATLLKNIMIVNHKDSKNRVLNSTKSQHFANLLATAVTNLVLDNAFQRSAYFNNQSFDPSNLKDLITQNILAGNFENCFVIRIKVGQAEYQEVENAVVACVGTESVIAFAGNYDSDIFILGKQNARLVQLSLAVNNYVQLEQCVEPNRLRRFEEMLEIVYKIIKENM